MWARLPWAGLHLMHRLALYTTSAYRTQFLSLIKNKQTNKVTPKKKKPSHKWVSLTAFSQSLMMKYLISTYIEYLSVKIRLTK